MERVSRAQVRRKTGGWVLAMGRGATARANKVRNGSEPTGVLPKIASGRANAQPLFIVGRFESEEKN